MLFYVYRTAFLLFVFLIIARHECGAESQNPRDLTYLVRLVHTAVVTSARNTIISVSSFLWIVSPDGEEGVLMACGKRTGHSVRWNCKDRRLSLRRRSGMSCRTDLGNLLSKCKCDRKGRRFSKYSRYGFLLYSWTMTRGDRGVYVTVSWRNIFYWGLCIVQASVLILRSQVFQREPRDLNRPIFW